MCLMLWNQLCWNHYSLESFCVHLGMFFFFFFVAVVVFCVVLTWEQAVKELIDPIRWRSHLSTTEATLLFLLVEWSSESFATLLVNHSILPQISRTRSFCTVISSAYFSCVGVSYTCLRLCHCDLLTLGLQVQTI